MTELGSFAQIVVKAPVRLVERPNCYCTVHRVPACVEASVQLQKFHTIFITILPTYDVDNLITASKIPDAPMFRVSRCDGEKMGGRRLIEKYLPLHEPVVMVQLGPVTLVVNVIFFSQLVVVPDVFNGPKS